ncbi:MAG: beta-glucosidase BglX [Pseudomonadota bacterium]
MVTTMAVTNSEQSDKLHSEDKFVCELLAKMTLDEKIGQLNLRHADIDQPAAVFAPALRDGRIGSILNLVDVELVNELQRIAVEESRLGIPLLVGRDVIHGFKTIQPIPLGLAATWNPDLVREGAKVAAREAAATGVNWTFAPMMDISRDARWGRIAESTGEDPHLTSRMAVAMVEGFQGENPAAPGRIAACVKHFAGYGAVEAGRDYATTNIPENELRNVYLPPFRAAIDAGAMSLMTSFSDLDGVPATGNAFLLQQVLREEWKFNGFVVSDWDSIRQLRIHGLTADDKGSALEAVSAGVDVEMYGDSYERHIAELLGEGSITRSQIDGAVENILRAKYRLGLFANPYTDPSAFPPFGDEAALASAQAAALQSVVMLKNSNKALPLSAKALSSIAVIGPLADARQDQLGTWVFDGDSSKSVTPKEAIERCVGADTTVRYVQAMATSRSRDLRPFKEAVDAAMASDVSVLFLGEEAILSGEAHSRADIDLPGAQAELVREICATGKPVVAVILAGRPLTLTNIIHEVDAILYAWHPGTMGGPAIADLLFGAHSPSGKLPATFPNMVGQIPIYYNQKNSGKPPNDHEIVHIDDIDENAPQTSLGMSAFHLDAGFRPLFPFGYGLSYGDFHYESLQCSGEEFSEGEAIRLSVQLTNRGTVVADEVAQLYVRDLVGSVTRPVKELKDFKRVRLGPGESTKVEFELHTDSLRFFDRRNELVLEAGEFHAWIGGDSDTDLRTQFRIVLQG